MPAPPPLCAVWPRGVSPGDPADAWPPGHLEDQPCPGRHTCACIPGHTATSSAGRATAPPRPNRPSLQPHPSACPGPGVRLLPRSPPPTCVPVTQAWVPTPSPGPLTPALGRRPCEPGHLPHTLCMQTLTLQRRQEVPSVTWPRRALLPTLLSGLKECPPGHSLGVSQPFPDGDTGATPPALSPRSPCESLFFPPVTPTHPTSLRGMDKLSITFTLNRNCLKQQQDILFFVCFLQMSLMQTPQEKRPGAGVGNRAPDTPRPQSPGTQLQASGRLWRRKKDGSVREMLF